MELVLVNGEACVRKEIGNENVYRTIAANKISGVPDIIKVESGVVYYKYINGETLKSRFDNERDISVDFIRFLAFSCASILSELKNMNIVHNDITPENVIISPKGEIYIIDFESATFNHKQTIGSEVNVSEYSSPELKNGEHTTFASDIYSLGKIIEEIDVNKRFSFVINKCCNDEIDKRYTSYTALVHEINTTYSSIERFDEEFNFFSHFTKKVLISIAVTIILGTTLGFYFASSSENSNVLLYIVFSVYALLAILDIFDYIRVILFKSHVYKKILPFKVALSFAMFIVTVLVSLILL